MEMSNEFVVVNIVAGEYASAEGISEVGLRIEGQRKDLPFTQVDRKEARHTAKLEKYSKPAKETSWKGVEGGISQIGEDFGVHRFCVDTKNHNKIIYSIIQSRYGSDIDTKTEEYKVLRDEVRLELLGTHGVECHTHVDPSSGENVYFCPVCSEYKFEGNTHYASLIVSGIGSHDASEDQEILYLKEIAELDRKIRRVSSMKFGRNYKDWKKDVDSWNERIKTLRYYISFFKDIPATEAIETRDALSGAVGEVFEIEHNESAVDLAGTWLPEEELFWERRLAWLVKRDWDTKHIINTLRKWEKGVNHLVKDDNDRKYWVTYDPKHSSAYWYYIILLPCKTLYVNGRGWMKVNELGIVEKKAQFPKTVSKKDISKHLNNQPEDWLVEDITGEYESKGVVSSMKKDTWKVTRWSSIKYSVESKTKIISITPYPSIVIETDGFWSITYDGVVVCEGNVPIHSIDLFSRTCNRGFKEFIILWRNSEFEDKLEPVAFDGIWIELIPTRPYWRRPEWVV